MYSMSATRSYHAILTYVKRFIEFNKVLNDGRRCSVHNDHIVVEVIIVMVIVSATNLAIYRPSLVADITLRRDFTSTTEFCTFT